MEVADRVAAEADFVASLNEKSNRLLVNEIKTCWSRLNDAQWAVARRRSQLPGRIRPNGPHPAESWPASIARNRFEYKDIDAFVA
ncbi:MAG: hypothetical protein OXD30_00925, partial [Bryobacterales bacterium]|nr:hypothetical protein [Bryobacterales bacterium]